MDPQVLADLLETFGADIRQSAQPMGFDGEPAILGENLVAGLRFEANGREWRVSQVEMAEDDGGATPYRNESQLRDAARVLPPVCFAPLLSQYTRLLRDPRWPVTSVPPIMAAMLHDPVLFHLLDTNPLAPLSDYRVSAMTRWWSLRAKTILRYENNTGRPLRELMGGEGAALGLRSANTQPLPSAHGAASSTLPFVLDGAAEQGGASADTRLPMADMQQGYRDIKTVLTLMVATSAPYRCSRPPNAAVSGCTARLVFCKDPSTVYLGLLLNTVLRDMLRKVQCSMPVFKVIAEAWGTAPSLHEILQAAWEEYQDVVQQIRDLLEGPRRTHAPTATATAAVTAAEAASSSSLPAFPVPTVAGAAPPFQTPPQQQQPGGVFHQPQHFHPYHSNRLPPAQPPRGLRTPLRLPTVLPSGPGPSASPAAHAAHAFSVGGRAVELGIPLSQARPSAAAEPGASRNQDGWGSPTARADGATAAGGAALPSGTESSPVAQQQPAAAATAATTSAPPPTTTATSAGSGSSAPAAGDHSSAYRAEDACRVCLESMAECVESPEMLLWWARCRLLAYQLLDNTHRSSVELTSALGFYQQLWTCAPLAREILEDDHDALLKATLPASSTVSAAATAAKAKNNEEEEAEAGSSSAHDDAAARQKKLESLQQHARRLYASLVGTIADLSKFWFSIRVVQSTVSAVASSAPETNVMWSIVNATVPSRLRFQREEFSSYAEHWQYALLVDDYVTQPMGFRVSTRGRTTVTQLLHVLSEYPTFYPALVTRTLAMLNRREMIVAELNGRLVSAVVRCLRFYLPPMPPVLAVPTPSVEEQTIAPEGGVEAATAAATAGMATREAARRRRTQSEGSRSGSSHSAMSGSGFSTPSQTSEREGRSGARRHINEEEEGTTTVAAAPSPSTAAAAAGGGGEEMNYEAYVLSDADDDESAADNSPNDKDDEEEATGRENAQAASQHPRPQQQQRRRVFEARCGALAQQQEAAMPVISVKAYDAIMTCLDVLRTLVRNAHLTVNPMGLLFAAPTPVDDAQTAAAASATVPQSSTTETAADATSSGADDLLSSEAAGRVQSAIDRACGFRLEPALPKSQCDLYTLLHQLVHQTRYGSLAAAALRFFSACVHYNVRDMVPLFAERGLLNTVITIARRPTPAAAPWRDYRSAFLRARSRAGARLDGEATTTTSAATATMGRPADHDGNSSNNSKLRGGASSSSSAGLPSPPLLFALDSLEENGSPNVPPRRPPPRPSSPFGLSADADAASSVSAELGPSPSASSASSLPAPQPLVTSHPPPTLLVRCTPHEDTFLNSVCIRLVVPEFVEAMTVHRATHRVFQKHLQWIPSLLQGLTVSPELDPSTLHDIRTLWDDEEFLDLRRQAHATAPAADDTARDVESGGEEERAGGAAAASSLHPCGQPAAAEEVSQAEQRRYQAQLECRSSPTYTKLVLSLMAPSGGETRGTTATPASAAGAPSVPVDATLIRLVELCRLHLKREEVGYKTLQSTVRDMSRVLAEVLMPSKKPMEAFRVSLQHELAQLCSSMRRFELAVKKCALGRRQPFLASSYASPPTADPAAPQAASPPTPQTAVPSSPLHPDGDTAASPTPAGVDAVSHGRSLPKSREAALLLLVRAVELCRTLNNFFAFFSTMDWTGQRRGPRLSRHSAERQEGAQAMVHLLRGTVHKFHTSMMHLWSLLGCEVPLSLHPSPRPVAELGVPSGASPLLSYVQVIIGQYLHPRVFGDYLRNTQPSSVLEAALKSTVPCILYYSTRCLYHVTAPGGEAGGESDADDKGEEEDVDGEGEREEDAARSQRHARVTPTQAARHRQQELRRILAAAAPQLGAVEVTVPGPLTLEAVTNVLRSPSMGDGIFLRQLLEAWRNTTVGSGGNTAPSSVGGFGSVLNGNMQRRDADGGQWRPVFGDVLRSVVDAVVVQAPIHTADVPSLLRSLRASSGSSSGGAGGGGGGGSGSAIIPLYDRSAESGAVLEETPVPPLTSSPSSATAATHTPSSVASEQLMQTLLLDSRHNLNEPTTAWMTAAAWRAATEGIEEAASGSGRGSSDGAIAEDVEGDRVAGGAVSGAGNVAGVTALSNTAAAATAGSERRRAAPELEAVALEVEAAETLSDSSGSPVSASAPSPPQRLLAGLPAVAVTGPRVATSAAARGADRSNRAEAASQAAAGGGEGETRAVAPSTPPLFTPVNPTKALQQWAFMTLFNSRRSTTEQAMHIFSLSAFRRDLRTRAVLPLSAASLLRTLQRELTSAFDVAVRNAYASSLGFPIVPDSAAEPSAGVAGEETAAAAAASPQECYEYCLRRWRAVEKIPSEGDTPDARPPPPLSMVRNVCPWFGYAPARLATMPLPVGSDVAACLRTLRLAAAHRALWTLAVLESVCGGGGGAAMNSNAGDFDSLEMTKVLTYTVQLLILLSRLFLAPWPGQSPEVSDGADAAGDNAAAAAVVATQGELRRCVVHMGVLLMSFLEGGDSRARGQHQSVVEALLHCVLDVWPQLPGFPMVPHMYVSAVEMMAQLKADTVSGMRLHHLSEGAAAAQQQQQHAGGSGFDAVLQTFAVDAVRRERNEEEGEEGVEQDAPLDRSARRGWRSATEQQQQQQRWMRTTAVGTVEESVRTGFLADLAEVLGRPSEASRAAVARLLASRQTPESAAQHGASPASPPSGPAALSDGDRYFPPVSYHGALVAPPATPQQQRMSMPPPPTARAWDRALPWLCDMISGTVFPLNTLNEAGQRLLRKRACKFLWVLWTATKTPEQPFLLTYMLDRVLSNARRNVVLLEYMGVLLSQLRSIVLVEALALTQLPAVMVRVVKAAIAEVAAEQAAWEAHAAAQKSAAAGGPAEAQKQLRDQRRRRRRAFAAEQETLHGQLVSFLSLFQSCRSDAPVTPDRFSRAPAAAPHVQAMASQCNYYDATRNTFCWNGHQCRRQHVVPVTGQRGGDAEDNKFGLHSFRIGTQRMLDELLTVLDRHGYSSPDTALPSSGSGKQASEAAAAGSAERTRHRGTSHQRPAPSSSSSPPTRVASAAATHVDPSQSPLTQPLSDVAQAGERLVSPSPQRSGDEAPRTATPTRLVRHERLTPLGFVSLLESTDRRAPTSNQRSTDSGSGARSPIRQDRGGVAVPPQHVEAAASAARPARAAPESRWASPFADAVLSEREGRAAEHTAAPVRRRHHHPSALVNLHEEEGAAGDGVEVGDGRPALRHRLVNPLDPQRSRLDPLRRAIVPYLALLSRDLCEEVLRLCLDFMAARLRDEALEKAEAREEAEEALLGRLAQTPEDEGADAQPPANTNTTAAVTAAAVTAAQQAPSPRSALDSAVVVDVVHRAAELPPSTASSSAARSPVTPPPLPSLQESVMSGLATPASPAALAAVSRGAAAAGAAAATPAVAVNATPAACAMARVAAAVRLPRVEVVECPVSEVVLHFLLSCFFTYYKPCQLILQQYCPAGEATTAADTAQRTNAAMAKAPPRSLSVLCAYLLSLDLTSRDKMVLLSEVLLTDMPRVEDAIWRDMTCVLATAVHVHRKAHKLSDASYRDVCALHESRLHLAATKNNSSSGGGVAVGGVKAEEPLSQASPATESAEAAAASAAEEVHHYVVPLSIFLANLETYITRQPTAFYYAFQRYCEVRWVRAKPGELPAAWLGVWVQPRPLDGKKEKRQRQGSKVRGTRHASASTSATSVLRSTPAAAAVEALPSRSFVERVSCFMHHLARVADGGRASNGACVLAAVEQLPGVCAALLSPSFTVSVPKLFSSILTTPTGAAATEAGRIVVPPFLALALRFCETLSETDRTSLNGIAAAPDFASALMSFNPVVVVDAVMQTLRQLVAELEGMLDGARESPTGTQAHRLVNEESEGQVRQQPAAGSTSAAAAAEEDEEEEAEAELAVAERSAANRDRWRILERCLHDLLCFLERGSPRAATAVLPTRQQRAAQQLAAAAATAGGPPAHETFLRFFHYVGDQGLLPLLFRVCRLQTCQTGRDATSLLQLMHHQILCCGEYQLATMLAPSQQHHAAHQQQQLQQRQLPPQHQDSGVSRLRVQRHSGMMGTGASVWPPVGPFGETVVTARAFDRRAATPADPFPGDGDAVDYGHVFEQMALYDLRAGPGGALPAAAPVRAAAGTEGSRSATPRVLSEGHRVDEEEEEEEEEEASSSSTSSSPTPSSDSAPSDFPSLAAMYFAGLGGDGGGEGPGGDGADDGDVWPPMQPTRRHRHYVSRRVPYVHDSGDAAGMNEENDNDNDDGDAGNVAGVARVNEENVMSGLQTLFGQGGGPSSPPSPPPPPPASAAASSSASATRGVTRNNNNNNEEEEEEEHLTVQQHRPLETRSAELSAGASEADDAAPSSPSAVTSSPSSDSYDDNGWEVYTSGSDAVSDTTTAAAAARAAGSRSSSGNDDSGREGESDEDETLRGGAPVGGTLDHHEEGEGEEEEEEGGMPGTVLSSPSPYASDGVRRVGARSGATIASAEDWIEAEEEEEEGSEGDGGGGGVSHASEPPVDMMSVLVQRMQAGWSAAEAHSDILTMMQVAPREAAEEEDDNEEEGEGYEDVEEEVEETSEEEEEEEEEELMEEDDDAEEHTGMYMHELEGEDDDDDDDNDDDDSDDDVAIYEEDMVRNPYLPPHMLGQIPGHRHYSNRIGSAGGAGGGGATSARALSFAACAYHAIALSVQRLSRHNVVETEGPLLPVLHAAEEQPPRDDDDTTATQRREQQGTNSSIDTVNAPADAAVSARDASATEEREARAATAGAAAALERLQRLGDLALPAERMQALHSTRPLPAQSLSPVSMRDGTPSEQLMRRSSASASPVSNTEETAATSAPAAAAAPDTASTARDLAPPPALPPPPAPAATVGASATPTATVATANAEAAQSGSGLDDLTARILALFAGGGDDSAPAQAADTPTPAPTGAAGAAPSPPPPPSPPTTTATAPLEPEPWVGVFDVEFLNEMPDDVRSELLFEGMQTLRGPEEHEVLGQRTRLYRGLLAAMPEAGQRHAMEVEARWVRVTRADDSGSELYHTIISVDEETRRDLLLQCDLSLLSGYPALLREATAVREAEQRRVEMEEAARAVEQARREREREEAEGERRRQMELALYLGDDDEAGVLRRRVRPYADGHGSFRERDPMVIAAAAGARASAPAAREQETTEGVMSVLFGPPAVAYTVINHELFLARRQYRCEAVLLALSGPTGWGVSGGGAAATADAAAAAWVTSPLLRDDEADELLLGGARRRRGGGVRGGNTMRRTPPPPPSAPPVLPPASSSASSAAAAGTAGTAAHGVVRLPASEERSRREAEASAAVGSPPPQLPSVPVALAALSESMVPVPESPYHPLALPLPDIPDAVLFNCVELLRLRASSVLTLPFNATQGVSSLDQQLQRLMHVLMGNSYAAVRLVSHVLDVMANTPTTAETLPSASAAAAVATTRDPPPPSSLAANQMFVKGAMVFIGSLIKQSQAAAACFFLLPDGVLSEETLKPLEAPLDPTERRCAEVGLWNRLWKVCRQHLHVQGFYYSLDQVLTQLVRSQKMFFNAAEDHEVRSLDDPLANEPLSESLILHPRHPHRLSWTNIRRLSKYEEGGYVCNVCGVNPGYDYCFHCSACQFDLCPSCSRERISLEQMRTRLSRTSALLLMAVPETVTSMTAFLKHPMCRANIAASVVQLMSRGLLACATMESAGMHSGSSGGGTATVVSGLAPASSSPSLSSAAAAAVTAGGPRSSLSSYGPRDATSTPSLTYASSNAHGSLHCALVASAPLQLLEQELVQMAETRVRAMKAARDDFRQEVHAILHRHDGTRAGGGSSTAAPSASSGPLGTATASGTYRPLGQHTTHLSIPAGYVFDTDTAMALLVKLDIKDKEGDAMQRLFDLYVSTSGAEPRAFMMLWRASQAYLHDVSMLLEHLTPQEVLPLPSCVSAVLQTFCRYHLGEGPQQQQQQRANSASARALTGSRSNLAGETEHFLRASTKPSSVSDRAVKELAEQPDAAQWVTAAGTRLSEEGLSSAEDQQQQRRLPRVVRMLLEENRVTLNTLLHWDNSLLKEGFAFLKYEPNLIDFGFKLADFRRRLGQRRGTNILLRVRRENCLLDSFKEISKQRSLGGQLHIRFEGEEGADAGGLTREWLQILSEALVDERYALFVHSQDSASFQPNPFSSVNPNHLEYFQFAGVVVALAIAHNVPIDIHFTRAFYRHIIGHRPVFSDLQSFDPELYTNLNWIMENDVSNLALTFAVNYNRFGSVEEEELEPNGKNTAVTNANKQQYVRLLCEFYMTKRTEEQMLRFLKGFYSVIPRREIQCFSENELELVISGMPDIDVEDLRTHTTYEGYSSTSPQIRWFWEAVNAMTKEDLANLLQFTTGSSKVPHGGFSHLEGSNGRSLPFTISRWAVNKDDLLPQAHTCFNKIDLPVYNSAAVLKEKLMIAITYGSMGFTMV